MSFHFIYQNTRKAFVVHCDKTYWSKRAQLTSNSRPGWFVGLYQTLNHCGNHQLWPYNLDHSCHHLTSLSTPPVYIHTATKFAVKDSKFIWVNVRVSTVAEKYQATACYYSGHLCRYKVKQTFQRHLASSSLSRLEPNKHSTNQWETTRRTVFKWKKTPS